MSLAVGALLVGYGVPRVADGMYEVHVPIAIPDAEVLAGVEVAAPVADVFDEAIRRLPSPSSNSARRAADEARMAEVRARVSCAWLRSAGVRETSGR